jgi:hypothetical protein
MTFNSITPYYSGKKLPPFSEKLANLLTVKATKNKKVNIGMLIQEGSSLLYMPSIY